MGDLSPNGLLSIAIWEYVSRKPRFLPCSVPIVGGNCNNGSKCGRYVNVNNSVSNANGNIGASLYLPLSFIGNRASGFDTDNAIIFPQHTLKINLSRGAVSKRKAILLIPRRG